MCSSTASCCDLTGRKQKLEAITPLIIELVTDKYRTCIAIPTLILVQIPWHLPFHPTCSPHTWPHRSLDRCLRGQCWPGCCLLIQSARTEMHGVPPCWSYSNHPGVFQTRRSRSSRGWKLLSGRFDGCEKCSRCRAACVCDARNIHQNNG